VIAVSRLRRNLIANLTAKIIIALAGLAFIPLYIHFLGIEQYAVVALLPTLNALSTILDLGISPAVNRELARLSAQPGSGQAMRDLVRTFEIFAWGIAAAIAVIVAILVPLLIARWGHSGAFSADRIQHIAYLIGVVVALGWPLSFYNGAVIGLQRQVALSTVNAIAALLRGAGAVVALWLVSPTIETFLIWQGVVAVTLPLIVAIVLWGYLPTASGRSHFSLQPLRKLWRLAAGMSGTSIVVVASENLDKLILSQLLPLDIFGYYMLAAAVASKLGIVMEPIMNSIFPRLSQLASMHNMDALRATYRSGVQLTAFAIFPMVMMFVFFGEPIMTLWTMNPVLGKETATLVAILIVGYALFSVIDITMVLDWALGRTKLIFWPKLIGMLVSLPLLYVLAKAYGAIGAALAWPIVNGGVFLIAVPLVHVLWAESKARRWYLQSLLPPLFASFIVAGGLSVLHPRGSGIISESALLVAISLATFAAAGLSTQSVRTYLRSPLRIHFPRVAISLPDNSE
jgi:O-antigen/teichoic acid export membrane protein